MNFSYVWRNLLFPHLMPVDIYNLSLTCKDFYNFIGNSDINAAICRAVDRRLKLLFGDQYGAFVNAMIESNAIISGSFIIEAALGIDYEKSDIDIFATRISQQFNSIIRRYLNFDVEPEQNDYNNKNILQITSFLLRDVKKIQIVRVTCDPVDLIQETDFSICKNSFSFTPIPHLETAYPLHIIKKISDIDLIAGSANINRVVKYGSRGFKFYPKHHSSIVVEFLAIMLQLTRIEHTTQILKTTAYLENILPPGACYFANNVLYVHPQFAPDPLPVFFNDIIHLHGKYKTCDEWKSDRFNHL